MARRAPPPKDAPPGWGTRIATMVFSGIFMVAFGAGGLFGGLLPISLTLWRAVEVAGWQPVSAQVLEAALDESRGSKGGSTYAVRARYAYRVNGQDHEGRRVGLLEWGFDNVGSWQRDWYARLQDARQREQPVVAWVDPARPARSILDRRVRWGLMAFHLPFAVLFTGVGVGAAVVFGRALIGRGRAPSKAATGSPATGAVDGALAPGVRGRLDRDGSRVEFRRLWPRVVAGVMLLLLSMVLAALAAQSTLGFFGRVLVAAAATLWFALALHLATLRWTWQLGDDGLLLVRGSWLHTRRWVVDRAALARAEPALVYTVRTNGGPQVPYHRLVLKQPPGKPIELTPALHGPEALAAVRAHLRAVAATPAPRG